MSKLTLDDFNRAAQLDQDAMRRVDAAVMERCDEDLNRYATAHDALYREAKRTAAQTTTGSGATAKTDAELDTDIRAVMASENVSYFDAFVLLGNGQRRSDQQRRPEAVATPLRDPREVSRRRENLSSAEIEAAIATVVGLRSWKMTDFEKVAYRKIMSLKLRESRALIFAVADGCQGNFDERSVIAIREAGENLRRQLSAAALSESDGPEAA